MATRNFTQEGRAYNSDNTSAIVTLGGQVIYSGPVPSTLEPPPPIPGTDIDTIAWTWSLPADFTGPQTLTIQITGGIFVLADTWADRMEMSNTAGFWMVNFPQTINGVQVNDPFTNVTIDGVAQTRQGNLPGQWYWIVANGQTFMADLNSDLGITTPDWAADQTYPVSAEIIYQDRLYRATQSSPAGTVPSTNPAIWSLPPTNWNINTSYPIDWKVLYNGQLYTAIQAVPPVVVEITDTQYWQPGGS